MSISIWREKYAKSRDQGNAYKNHNRGTWVAQSVLRPTSAQVMISWSVSSSPVSGSVLTALSLELLQILCLLLSLSLPRSRSVFVSQK